MADDSNNKKVTVSVCLKSYLHHRVDRSAAPHDINLSLRSRDIDYTIIIAKNFTVYILS